MSVSNIERVRLEKAAVDEGFGLKQDDEGDWLAYDSLGAPASLRLSVTTEGYVVAVNHASAFADLEARWPVWTGTPPLGFHAFAVPDTAPLHELIGEIWRLTRSLPKEPLREFEAKTRGLPTSTEAERLVMQRVGQNIFRDALLDYWGRACAVTGVTEPSLLRASHIIPWATCESDEERLNVYNGLLLAAHLDAAFDAGLIGFDDNGRIVCSPHFNQSDKTTLGIGPEMSLKRVAPDHLPRLLWHRNNVFR